MSAAAQPNEIEEIPLPEGIKPSYWNDLDLLEDLWKVGLGRLFDQGDIYVDRNGKTFCTGTEIIWESHEHIVLKDSVAHSFNEWARNTGNKDNLFCTTESPVSVSNTYRNGEVDSDDEADADLVTKPSVKKPDVAVYSGERQMRGKLVKILTIRKTYVEPVETEGGRRRRKVIKQQSCDMSPQLLVQIGVTNPYSTERDNMDTLMKFAGAKCFIDCQRPKVGYYIKLLHAGRVDNSQVTISDNNEEEGETFEPNPDVRHFDSYKAYGFLVIKVLPDNRMPDIVVDTLEKAKVSTNTNLIQGKVFEVKGDGKFRDDAIISIDMREEVGIEVDDDQRILKISFEELRRKLERDGTVFQQEE